MCEIPRQRVCGMCRLRKTRRQVVVSDGGIRRCGVVVVGEAPGADEDERGKPFVGVSGRLLRRAVASYAGFVLGEDAVVLNTVSCHPPRNRDPKDDEKAACLNWLRLNLRRIKPKIVLSVGKHAAATFTSERDRGIFLSRQYLYEMWREYGFIMMHVWHPSYLLRNRKQLNEWHRHLRIFGERRLEI